MLIQSSIVNRVSKVEEEKERPLPEPGHNRSGRTEIKHKIQTLPFTT